MNNNIKISLTIELEGSTLVRKRLPELITYSISKKELNFSNPLKGKEGDKIVKRGRVNHYPLETKPAYLHINMTIEAFNYMTSNECPYWSTPKDWNKMKPKERLEAHLQRTCEHHRGKSFTYFILED